VGADTVYRRRVLLDIDFETVIAIVDHANEKTKGISISARKSLIGEPTEGGAVLLERLQALPEPWTVERFAGAPFEGHDDEAEVIEFLSGVRGTAHTDVESVLREPFFV
jgi:hypothetical protein